MTQSNRIQLSYTLNFTTPFHLGTGLRSGLIDRTIVRDRNGYLYVPGSTLKGVVRDYCEQIARLYETLDTDMHRQISDPHDDKLSFLAFGHRTTMISRIFGSHAQPGRLFFDNAYQTQEEKGLYDAPKDEDSEKDGQKAQDTSTSQQNKNTGKREHLYLQTDVYTQVQLGRLTRTSIPGALYTSEFGLKNLAFTGSINGLLTCTPVERNTEYKPTYSLLLLLAGLLMLERIGGNKSTGKGECRCRIDSLIIDGKEHPTEYWKSWLGNNLDALGEYTLNEAEYSISEEAE